MGKIRGKTNLVPTTKKNYAPLGASHNLSPKVFFENGKQCVGNLWDSLLLIKQIGKP